MCRAAGATKALIWWAKPIIAPSGGPVQIILSVARFTKVRATESITPRFGGGVRTFLLGPPMLGRMVGGGHLIPSKPRLYAWLPFKGTCSSIKFLRGSQGKSISKARWSCMPNLKLGDWMTHGDSSTYHSLHLAPLPPASLDQEWACVETDPRNGDGGAEGSHLPPINYWMSFLGCAYQIGNYRRGRGFTFLLCLFDHLFPFNYILSEMRMSPKALANHSGRLKFQGQHKVTSSILCQPNRLSPSPALPLTSIDP